VLFEDDSISLEYSKRDVNFPRFATSRAFISVILVILSKTSKERFIALLLKWYPYNVLFAHLYLDYSNFFSISKFLYLVCVCVKVSQIISDICCQILTLFTSVEAERWELSINPIIELPRQSP